MRRLRHLLTTVKRATALDKQDKTGTRNGTVQRKSYQAALLHAASSFDIKECGLD